MTKFTLFITLLLVNVSCAKIEQKREIFTDFKEHNNLKIVDSILLSRDVFKVGQMQMFDDWLVLTRYGSETFLYAYNLKSGQEIDFLYNGRAANETGNVMGITKIDKSTLWVNGDSPNAAMVYDINDFESGDIKPKIVYDLNMSAFNNSILSNNNLIYFALNVDNNTTMYYAQNVEGDTLKFFGEFPAEDIGLAKLPTKGSSRGITYQGSIHKHPSKNLAYFSPIYALGFDIINTKDLEISKRIFYHYPIMEVMDRFGATFVKATAENVGGFTESYCNDKYIYFILTDKNSAERSKDRDQYLLVYDWDGDPVRSFRLDKYAKQFTVSDDNQTLYTLYEDDMDSDRVILYTYKL